MVYTYNLLITVDKSLLCGIAFRWKKRGKGVLNAVVTDSIHERRLDLGEEEWTRQIAALTIQLAWRKYYR